MAESVPSIASTPAIDLRRRGLMFILSSPSGAGKTTIARRLLAEDDNLALSVSATTRPIRPGEVDGRDYHFIDRPRFDEMVAEGEFLEWAEVFGNCYGTPRKGVMGGLKDGQDYLFDVDWQGAHQLRDRAPADVVTIFILPPSIAELEKRLRGRRTDSDEVIEGRMERARSEIEHGVAQLYDYILINDDIDACYAKVRTILHAERLKRARQTGLLGFIRDLLR